MVSWFIYRGFQAYLAGAPDYNFDLYKKLVHEITSTFKKISDEIIEIKRSVQERSNAVAVLIGKIQDEEKGKLEKVRVRKIIFIFSIGI